MRLNRTDRAFYVSLFERYGEAHPAVTTVEARDVIEWAAGLPHDDAGAQGLALGADAIRAFHVGRLSESLRGQTFRDRHGRSVRKFHCVESPEAGDGEGGKPTQRFFWANVDDAPESHLASALDQRREKIAGDVESLRADIDYIANERRPRPRSARLKRVLQMSFDFTPPEEPASS